jgi:hypothetical protein
MGIGLISSRIMINTATVIVAKFFVGPAPEGVIAAEAGCGFHTITC